MKKITLTRFDSIPQPQGGRIHMSITHGDVFGRDDEYHVFLGGCGVGQRPTLKEAKELLLERAAERLKFDIQRVEAEAAHYRRELANLALRNQRKEIE